MNEIERQHELRNRKNIKKYFVKAVVYALVLIPFILVWLLYYQNHVMSQTAHHCMALSLLFVVLYHFFAKSYDALQISYNRAQNLFVNQALTILFSDAFMFCILWIISEEHLNLSILPALIALIAQLVLALSWCIFSRRWYFKTYPASPTIVIYDAREGLEKVIAQHELEQKYDIRQVLNINDVLQNMSVLESIETVFFSGVHSRERNIVLKYCIEHSISVYVIPRLGDVIMSGARRMHMLHLPILRVERYNPAIGYLVAKRFFDLLLSSILLIIISPIMCIVALAVKSDGGPALYKQVRLTKDGKKFKILKFRSMRVDAEKDGVARLSTGEKDDRITKVGHIIRACRLDELPQLLNIFCGDMSFVGPRPERPEIAEQYEEVMPEFKLRLQAKAGLTGYAQVYGKYNTTPYDKLNMDLMYIAHPSIREDISIMFSTVAILFVKDSTEGIDENKSTAM